jgi:biotin/methionine sulfoxide reductase
MAETVPHSSHWGAFEATVKDGKLIGVRPAESDPDPSPILTGMIDALTSQVRVAAPSIRRGWLEHGPGVTSARRGGEEFVEVSWDRALDLIAGEIARVIDEHGNEALFGGSYGWSSAGRFHHAKTQLNRFYNSLGGCTGQKGNYSYAAASAILPHVVGNDANTTGEATSWDALAGYTDLWVTFGGTPLKNAQVESGGTTRHAAREGLERMRASGTEFVGITPLRDDLPDFLQAQWIAARVNTDTAIMLGLAYTILVDGHADEAFLNRYCVGWERFRAYLLGDEDDVPKTAEWAAEIADVEPGVLRDLARRMADGRRTFITTAWSLQRADHGEQPFWMTIALAAMIGQIGLPGGGFGFAYGGAAGIGNPTSPFGTPSMRAGFNATGSFIPVARVVEMLEHPGDGYDFDGERRTYPDIRLIHWAGGNPFHHHQDINRMIAAWRRPETVIVNEPWWTATARHADIVLPATTTLERNDIGSGSRDLAIVAMHRAVDPVGLARNDYDIFSELASRLGVLDEYTEGLDEAGWLRRMYGQYRDRAAAAGTELPDFDAFWEAGGITLPSRARVVIYEAFREDPDAHALSTPSGRIELFSETIDGFGYDDCPGHPCWLEPEEWLGNEDLARDFPLHLVSNQPKSRLHGQMDMAGVSLASKLNGREPARVHPVEARRRGLTDGDTIVVRSRRGRCLAGLQIDDAVRPGVLQLATGAWYDPLVPGSLETLDKHGNPNVLTPDHGTSRLGQGPSAHSALVEIERYDGTLPEISCFAPPTIISPATQEQH